MGNKRSFVNMYSYYQAPQTLSTVYSRSLPVEENAQARSLCSPSLEIKRIQTSIYTDTHK